MHFWVALIISYVINEAAKVHREITQIEALKDDCTWKAASTFPSCAVSMVTMSSLVKFPLLCRSSYLCCRPSTHSVTEAQMLPLCFLRASLASALEMVPVVFSSASWPTLLARVITVSIMLVQFSPSHVIGFTSPQWLTATWTSSEVKPDFSAS